MRNFFADHLASAAGDSDDIFLVYGDIGNRLFDTFKKVAPKRFVNAGIAEASMISMASGLAKAGFIPFVYTINPFIYLKALEQIKIDVCYPELPVVMVGTGGGLSYSELGTTHHSLEDVGVLRNIPNLEIFVPSDEFELEATINTVLKRRKPAYIRIGKKESQKVHTRALNPSELSDEFLSVAETNGAQVALLTNGTIAMQVKEAYDSLSSMMNIDLWTAPKVNPLRFEFVENFLMRYRKVFIIEEHRNSGGLFSLLAEVTALSRSNVRTRLIPLNTGDKFHTGLGAQEDARRSLGMDARSLQERVHSEA